jgi:hypothetical protein
MSHALYFSLLLWYYSNVNANISFSVTYEVVYSVNLSRLLKVWLLSWSESG